MQIFKSPNYDFIRWRWHAVTLSALVILAGLGLVASRGGLPLGVDFSGGSIVVVKFVEPVSEQAVRQAIPGETVVQSYGQPEQNEILIRLPQIEGEEQGTNLEEGANAALAALGAAGLPDFEVVSTELVGPVIGAELQRKGVYATIASLVGIALYIAVRFRPSFAVGAAVAALHDILVTLAFLSFFGYELSLNVVAAILAITGYSVNDTIVVYDRVRENMRTMRKDSLSGVVNRSVNQTLGRTIITSGTTFGAVLMLYMLGGEVLHAFAFTMMVGIVSGTYSTVFIAAAVAIMMSQRKVAARTAAAAAAEADQASQAPRPRNKARKARAS
jgi:preprotein translocase subunit SecF